MNFYSVYKKQIIWFVRIIISLLFLVSAISKCYPIYAFEKQLVDLNITNWCNARYFARLIISLELSIAIAILQNHFIKKFVIPVTGLLLVGFCIHLGIQMYQHGATAGNCGCFGQLIPMTPLEAFIKNIVTLLLLLYLYKNVNESKDTKKDFVYILLYYFLSAFIIFFTYPFCPCPPNIKSSEKIANASDSVFLKNDTNTVSIDSENSKKVERIDSVKKDTTKNNNIINEPKKTISKFSAFTDFNNQKINLDQGKKIVCLFIPGCDHCRAAAKELIAVSKSHKLPSIYVIFMNEETFKIPEFFTEIKQRFPYLIIEDIPAFFNLLGRGANTPGVVYLWNGNIIKNYEGLDKNKFDANDLVKKIESNTF